MIKINLLAIRIPKEHIIVNKQVFSITALVIVALLAGMFGRNWVAEQKASVEKRLTVAKSELSSLEKVAKRMKALEKKKERRVQILEAIKTLQEKKIGPTPFLDSINVMLPPDIWLTSISESGGVVSISGLSFSNPGVAELMRSLDSSEHFTETELSEIQKTTVQKEVVKRFTMTTNWTLGIEKEKEEQAIEKAKKEAREKAEKKAKNKK